MTLTLSKKHEKQITDNLKELSMVEGNLLGAVELQKSKKKNNKGLNQWFVKVTK